MKTVSNLPFNVSARAILAFLFPFIGTVVAAGIDWINTNQFDVTTIRTAAAGLVASLLALVGAYVAKAPTVVSTASLQADPADTLHG
jgi:energy-converting hydrogenase Eha subunit A